MPTIKLGTFTAADFATSDAVKTIDTGYSSPPRSIVTIMATFVSTAFALPGSSFLQIVAGTVDNAAEYSYGADATVVGNSIQPLAIMDSIVTSTPITVSLYSDAALSGLTDGSVELEINILTTDQFTQVVTGGGNATTQVTSDCWLMGVAIVGTTGDVFSIGKTLGGSELGTGAVNSLGTLSFSNPEFFSETVDTTIYVTAITTNDYKIKLAIK